LFKKAQNKASQEKLFEEIFYSNLQKVRYYAYHYLKDKDVAESVAQDVFAALWENRDKLDFGQDLFPYMIVLTKNKSINVLRKKNNYEKFINYSQVHTKSTLNMEALKDPSSTNLYSSEIESLIKKGVKKMPEKIKSTFLLSRFSNYSNEEISKKQLISVKTVESRITSALKILRVILKDYLILIIGYFIC